MKLTWLKASVRTWLATQALFLLSIFTGFSIGRYFVVFPLLLTALALSKGQIVVRAVLVGAAISVWWIFSVYLFGRFYLLNGMLIEVALCNFGFALLAILERRRKMSITV